MLPAFGCIVDVVKPMVLPCCFHRTGVVHLRELHVKFRLAVKVDSFLGPYAAPIPSAIAGGMTGGMSIADGAATLAGMHFYFRRCVFRRNHEIVDDLIPTDSHIHHPREPRALRALAVKAPLLHVLGRAHLGLLRQLDEGDSPS